VFIGKDMAKTRSYSEKIANEIDEEVKKIVDECYQRAKEILNEHINVLHRCAELLIEKERITREEFEALFE
jgi:cell division protease FtsH